MDACGPSQYGGRATKGVAPGITSRHSAGGHGSPDRALPRGDCNSPHVLLAPRELWDPPRRVVVPEDPTLRRGCGGVLPRHPPVPGVPRPHPLEAGQCLHGGAIHGVGDPHRQGALDRPCLRLPIRCMALCGLQRIHHRPGGTPRTRGLATRGSHTSVPQHGPRPRPPPATSIPISPAPGSMPCWTRWTRRQDALRTLAPTPWDGSAPCRNPASVAPTRASRSTTPYLTHTAPCSPPTTPTLRLPCLSATPPSTSTPTPSVMASSHGETTSRSPASASPCSPRGTRPVPSATCPPPGTTSSLARLTRSSAPTTIGGLQPGSPRGAVPDAAVRPLPRVPSSFGATSSSCWL